MSIQRLLLQYDYKVKPLVMIDLLSALNTRS